MSFYKLVQIGSIKGFRCCCYFLLLYDLFLATIILSPAKPFQLLNQLELLITSDSFITDNSLKLRVKLNPAILFFTPRWAVTKMPAQYCPSSVKKIDYLLKIYIYIKVNNLCPKYLKLYSIRKMEMTKNCLLLQVTQSSLKLQMNLVLVRMLLSRLK